MDFSTLFPQAADWVAGLPKSWPFVYLQDVYAPFGALHLIGMALVGGCALVINLRLLGAGMTDEAPSTIERNLRAWQIAGAVIVIGTGLIIGALNSEKLFYSPAFFIKMMCMFAALIFTFGCVNLIAQKDGKVTPLALGMGAAGLLLFLFGMGVFAITDGVNPGTFHVLTAGYAVLLLFGKRTRIIAALAFAVMFGGILESYFAAGMDSDRIDLLNLGVVRSYIGGILLVVLIGYEIWREDATPGGRAARLVAVLSFLAWVATAAGGRWIGFS